MESNVLYSRDLLFPTENINEPGCVHIDIYRPDNNSRIPVVVESKTEHSPVKYIDSIVRIMQSDMLDRIFVDIRKNVSLYIVANEEYTGEFGANKYVRVNFTKDKIDFEGVDEVDI